MDLSTIKKNIENGLIRSTAEFQRDIMLMFQNAVMYNSSDHDVYHMAVEMQRDVLEQIQVLWGSFVLTERGAMAFTWNNSSLIFCFGLLYVDFPLVFVRKL